ncbi:MAG: hypothetical protein ABI743_09390, partial [bacterium]
MRLRTTFAGLAALLALQLVACSGGGSPDPVAPAPSPAHPAASQDPIIPSGVPGGPETFQALSGVYSLDIAGGASPSATLEPERLAEAKGDAYAVDATNFLRVSPCHDCLEVVGLSSGPTPDTVNVDFALRHPFALPAL